jgi:hypothetical protein
MNLKLNSWYVWLWEYTYAEDLPNNLCPLFWKLVVAIFLFIPNVILRIPTLIFNMFTLFPTKRGNGRTGIGLFIYVLTAGTILLSIALYHYWLWLAGSYSYDSTLATIGGFILCVGTFFILREVWIQKNASKTIQKTVSNNIIVNYSKSWYNNHCPKINWK